MNQNGQKIAVASLFLVGGGLAAYAIYDAWRLSVPLLPSRDRKKAAGASSAALDPSTAERTPDPDVDVSVAAKGASKNAASRRVVSEGRPPLLPPKLGLAPYRRHRLGQTPGQPITIAELFTPITSDVERAAFLSALPARAKAYGEDILRASDETGVSPYLIAGIANAETAYGETPVCAGKGPACKSGPYLGLMQFGKKEAKWSLKKLPNGRPQWTVPYFNFRRGAEYIVETKDLFLRLLKNAKVNPETQDLETLGQWVVAAYNKGAGSARKGFLKRASPDSITHVSEDFDTGVSLPYVTRVYNHMYNLKSDVPTIGV